MIVNDRFSSRIANKKKEKKDDRRGEVLEIDQNSIGHKGLKHILKTEPGPVVPNLTGNGSSCSHILLIVHPFLVQSSFKVREKKVQGEGEPSRTCCSPGTLCSILNTEHGRSSSATKSTFGNGR